jgi:NADH-quinone oxidoreductase subunit H
MIIADVPIGILYVLALSSLAVYGVVLGGWASNNKYAFLGGLRASAQMVSYEVALGLSLIAVLMLAGNVTLPTIIAQQQMGIWYALPLSLAFILFIISAFAETNRLPFDMPEAESELITGYHTEYSAMKFSAFMISEFGHMVTASALMATLFLGGWDIPVFTWDDIFWHQGQLISGFDAAGAPIAANPAWWKTLATFMMFAAKTGFFLVLYIWIRWTLPRFRYDQVMALGWKVMLPTSLAYVMLMAASILVLDELGMQWGTTYGLVLTAISGAATLSFVFFIDRGRTITGSAAQRGPRLETVPTSESAAAGD